jgi:hypothetical protein
MKKIKLFNLEKMVSTGETNAAVKFSSARLFEIALSNYQEGLKGVDSVYRTLAVYIKVKNIGNNGTLELEDAEFDLLYKACDATQWTGITLNFPEFFEELKRGKAAL